MKKLTLVMMAVFALFTTSTSMATTLYTDNVPEIHGAEY